MTDILLDSVNDLYIEGGQIALIDTIEVLTRQRILNKLRTFTNTLFTNVNYGVDVNLVFQRGTKALLDQHLKTLISDTEGVIKLVSFSSNVGTNRVYTCQFQYQIESGEIVGIRGIDVTKSTIDEVVSRAGVWRDGYWDYSGIWSNEEVWGDD